MTKKIVALILSLVFISTASPAMSAPLSITYLYGSSNAGYLNQLKPLQNSVNKVMPSYFDINADGSLKVNVSKDFVEQAQQMGFEVVPFVSNHFNKSAGHAALLQQEQVIDAIVAAVKEYDLDGVNLDLENIPVADKELYNQFVKNLAAKLHELGKPISIALPATETLPAGGWAKAYDYKTLAETVDYIIVMTYDQNWASPGPVAGLPWVESVVSTLLKVVPKEKLVLGLPFYGRWWINGQRYKEVGYDGALTVASNYVTEAKWDSSSQSPYLAFQDASGRYHQLWYENSFSLGAKLGLIEKYDLAGAASWRLGLEDPEFWPAYQRFITGLQDDRTNDPVNRGDERDNAGDADGDPDSSPDDAGNDTPTAPRQDVNQAFSDVNGHWAAADINFLYQQNLINGYDDGTFGPKRSITRAEATAILTRWLDLPRGETVSFNDMAAQHWAYQAVTSAASMGVVGGYQDGSFRPEQSITRAELTALLGRIFSGSGASGPGFSDVAADHWAYQSIVALQGQGLVNGYDDGTFRPQAPVTRAEFSAMLSRIIKAD